MSVVVPSLPGCLTQGPTERDALRNSEEAIELHLETEIEK
ncbi:MAG: type II toxin-antitoxin system HicB family antitoxin [Nitrososphaerota archaeon]